MENKLTRNIVVTGSSVILFAILIIVVWVVFAWALPKSRLSSFEKEVNNISLPINIEKVAIRSAVGDSGGNGDYSTLRVVLVVKTEFDKNELKNIIERMELQFSKHYKTLDNTPIYYITKCESSKFQSPRQFVLDFNELEEINDFSNYYFIEFVE